VQFCNVDQLDACLTHASAHSCSWPPTKPPDMGCGNTPTCVRLCSSVNTYVIRSVYCIARTSICREPCHSIAMATTVHWFPYTGCMSVKQICSVQYQLSSSFSSRFLLFLVHVWLSRTKLMFPVNCVPPMSPVCSFKCEDLLW